MRRIRALIIKELLQIKRDPSSLWIAVILPLILLFIYGFGISLDAKDLKIGIVLQHTNPQMQSFASALTYSPFFSVQFSENQKELSQKVVDGTLRGIVTVPFYFSDFEKRNQKAPIYVVADGSEPNTANFVQNYIHATFLNWMNQEAKSNALQPVPSVTYKSRFWYNEEVNSRHFLLPGSIAIIMTLIGTILTSLVIAREWESGTIESLMATPITIWEILIGKFVPYYFLGMGSMIICTFISYFLFGVPFRGSLWILFLVSSVFLFTALATGLLISSLTRNQFLASQIAIITAFLPAFMLSGFIFEISSMPQLIQLITHIIPAKYFVPSLKTLFLVGNVWSLIWPNILIMALFCLILFIIMRIISVKRLD